MDDGELDYSNQDVFSCLNLDDFEGLFDEFLTDTNACTHMHTCNPPGPDSSHSHTCFHVHTKILPAPAEDKVVTDDTTGSLEKKSKKRHLCNREAVRKYREKKKARTASFEDEVAGLRTLTQQLPNDISALEAELTRRKCFLVDIRGRIQGAIGSFPYQKSAKSGDVVQSLPHSNLSRAYVVKPCDLQCVDQVCCLHPGMEGKGGVDGIGLNNACEIGNIQCMGNPNQDVFSGPSLGDQLPNSYHKGLFDEFLTDTHSCTHAHTCNSLGPDYSHSHTCFHVHTKILPAPVADKVVTDDTTQSSEKKSKKNPLGNREAVRKYREKKKAQTTSLEDEVPRLRALAQQLLKYKAALEAEIARLKCLLVDFRGRIEGEIGSFPYQKSAKSGDGLLNLPHSNLSSAYVMNPCDLRCNDQVYCLHPGMEGKGGVDDMGLNSQGFNNACEIGSIQCMGNPDLGLKELPGCIAESIGNVANS